MSRIGRLLLLILLLPVGCGGPPPADRIPAESPVDLALLAPAVGESRYNATLEAAEQVVRSYTFEGRRPLEGWRNSLSYYRPGEPTPAWSRLTLTVSRRVRHSAPCSRAGRIW